MKKIALASIALLGLATSSFAAVNEAGCKGCHGQNWEKKALGKSLVVADMTKADMAAKLLAFKAGTEGTIMKGQVGRYSEADLKAFADKYGK